VRAPHAALTAVWLTSALGQTTPPAKRTPRFEDYPVTEVFTGSPAPPRLLKPEERRYRTVINNGVKKGYGVLEEPEGRERPGPNFAGQYIVVQWRCGTECFQYAIVDAKTGRIFQPPVPGEHQEYFDTGQLDFRLRSRLMIVKTNCVTGDPKRCDRDYFVWTDHRFQHLHRDRRNPARPADRRGL
jgi:hypothetical protein